MIHVCFGLHDGDGRYSKFTGTTIASIFANTSEQVTAHILHDATLTQDNRDKFVQLAERHNQRVDFHNVDELCPNEIKFLNDNLAEKVNARFTVGAFYRLLVKKIFDIDRIIYLDSDMIVNLDVGELWSVDLGDYPLAAVPEISIGLDTRKALACRNGLVRTEDYFNSGTVLFNLARLSDKVFEAGAQFLAHNPSYTNPDQDILNVFFADNYLKLDGKFNAFVLSERRNEPVNVARKIYHYAEQCLGLDVGDGFWQLWAGNFLRSPWCDVQALNRLYEKFSEYDAQVKTLLIRVTGAFNGKRRAFVTFAFYVDAIKQIFDATDNELLVVETFADFDDLIRAIERLRSTHVFLSMVENFPLMRKVFSDVGLVEGKDFFNGLKFLAATHGYRFNAYQFIKAL